MANFVEKTIKKNRFVQTLYIFFGSLFFRFLSLFVRIDEKTILFSSMSGKNYEFSSPFWLYDKIKNTFGDDYRYVWAFEKEKKSSLYDGEFVTINSLKYFLIALKAKIWITDVNIERGLHFKRKKQYYVNTWHGGVTKAYPASRKDYNFSNVNIFCSDGELYDQYFSKYYKVNPSSFLHCGRPREDSLFELIHEKEKIKKRFCLDKDKAILLYMPTWRDYETDLLDLNYIAKCLPDFVIIFHSHNLSNNQPIFNQKNIVDFSDVKDLNSLYAISDLMISDYSTCIYDFLLTGKPVLLFAKDYSIYEKERGLYVDFKNEFPNSICDNEDTLIQKIKKTIKGCDLKEYEEFLKKVVDIKRDRKATDVVFDKMKCDNVFN